MGRQEAPQARAHAGTKFEDALAHIIDEQPGLTRKEIILLANRPGRPVRAALRDLRTTNRIQVVNRVGHRLYFTKSLTPRRCHAIAWLRVSRTRTLVGFILANQPCSLGTLKAAGGAPWATARALARLRKDGLVEVRKSGGALVIVPGPDLRLAWAYHVLPGTIPATRASA